MSNNMPDITAPVPAANRSRFIGVTGNINSGSAQSGKDPNGNLNVLTNGSANNNIGGNVYRSPGQSSNQFPVSAASTEFVGGGGSAPQPQTNSNNPPSIQAETTDRVKSEYVVRTTPGAVNAAAAGHYTQFPKSTEQIDLGQSSSSVGKTNYPSNTNNLVTVANPNGTSQVWYSGSTQMASATPTIVNEQKANAYVGITDPITNDNSSLPAALVDEFRIVKDTNGVTSGRIDGKAQGADSVDKFIALGDNVHTKTIDTLPGGVPQSQLINNPALDSNFPASSGTSRPGSY